jgi:hypothetical protein
MSVVELLSKTFVYETQLSWKSMVYSGVACDSQDRTYIVRRTHVPAILVFDSDGNYVKSFGEDLFTVPHGIWISPNDELYCTDIADHTVTKLSLDGNVLMTLGTKNKLDKTGFINLIQTVATYYRGVQRDVVRANLHFLIVSGWTLKNGFT